MIVGWLDVSYSADYPARLSPSASNICGNSVDTNTKDVILRVINNVNPQVESGLVIARVRSRVAMGGHDIPKAKVRERYDLTCWSLLPLYDGQLAIRNPCARSSG
jgi:hypothetical protein